MIAAYIYIRGVRVWHELPGRDYTAYDFVDLWEVLVSTVSKQMRFALQWLEVFHCHTHGLRLCSHRYYDLVNC